MLNQRTLPPLFLHLILSLLLFLLLFLPLLLLLSHSVHPLFVVGAHKEAKFSLFSIYLIPEVFLSHAAFLSNNFVLSRSVALCLPQSHFSFSSSSYLIQTPHPQHFTYVRMYVQAYRFPLCSTGLRPPLGPKFKRENKKKIKTKEKEKEEKKRETKKNQSPKGKRWSSVPLPCFGIS